MFNFGDCKIVPGVIFWTGYSWWIQSWYVWRAWILF